MKKFFVLVLFLLFTGVQSFATTHVVQVSNFQFSPKTLNAVVGDTVQWIWVSGFHTTSSTSVPAGALPWDENITSSSTQFKYKLTTAGAYEYFCAVHPTQMTATITVTDILPVVLSNFSIALSGQNALLGWQTAVETNVSHFAILRSVDGDNFEQIGIVEAKAAEGKGSTYSFTDNRVGAAFKYLYYKLGIADKDGKQSYSSTELFRNNAAVQKLIVKLSPNPISRPGHLMLQFNADQAGAMLSQLFDASGKLIKQYTMDAVQGLNNGHFHIGDVAAGTYSMRFSMGNLKETYTIVVQ